MPRGYSLHIGLNKVDAKHYEGWDGKLNFAEQDAIDMRSLAIASHLDENKLLLSDQATRKNILSSINHLTKIAKKGDFIFVSYSGHGSVMPNMNTQVTDKTDETWCCFDGMLLDKELLNLWSQCSAGVQVLLVSDSCHSGDITRDIPQAGSEIVPRTIKQLNKLKASKIVSNHADFYKTVEEKIPVINPNNLSAHVKLIGACDAGTVSYEGNGNGELTLAVKTAFDSGNFKGNYDAFFKLILEKIATKEQTPVLLDIGAPDPAFDNAQPFTFEPDKLSFTASKIKRNTTTTTKLLVDFGKKIDKSAPTIKSADFVESYAFAGRDIAVFKPKTKGEENPWDSAHALYKELKLEGKDVQMIEPETHFDTCLGEVENGTKQDRSIANPAELTLERDMFLPTWPHPPIPIMRETDLLWHLREGYSQLAPARDSLMNDPNIMAQKPIRIAHIDTGFFPYKDFMPEKLNVGLCKSFVDGESENLGVDIVTLGKADNLLDKLRDNLGGEQQGHGTATLAILAGPKVDSPKGLEGYTGYLGAVPFADIICCRIQDSVALLKTSAFEKAVYYAVEQGCEVITMSMAGAPSHRWAEAVNYAYERGVTIVTAVGNSWTEGFKHYMPTYLLFPARFDRVIGAGGVAYNQKPYVFEANRPTETTKMAGGVHMQGNWGPDEHMHHVVSAYTPNVFWADTDQDDQTKKPEPYFKMTGGGTSSATPQIAAAAALWITKHKAELVAKGYSGTWRQVEAVRKAIFGTAQLEDPAMFKYLGKGKLKALDALAVPPAAPEELTQSAVATTPFLPLISTLFGLLKDEATPDDTQMEMLALELTHLVVSDPVFEKFGNTDFLSNEGLSGITDAQKQELKNLIAQHPDASETLKKAFDRV